jgi:hypothetical protein
MLFKSTQRHTPIEKFPDLRTVPTREPRTGPVIALKIRLSYRTLIHPAISDTLKKSSSSSAGQP